MNADRRKILHQCKERLESLRSELEDIKDEIQGVRDDEECSRDNLPESLQESEKGETMQ